MEVSSPPGTVIGYIEEEWTFCKPKFSIRNSFEDILLMVDGPICQMNHCFGNDIKYKIKSDGDNVIGEIAKQWAGFAQEYFTDADNFCLTFPIDLDVKQKALIIGACFLIVSL